MRLTGIILDSKSLPAHLQTETDIWEQPSETEAQSDSAIDSLVEEPFWLSLLLGGEREETVRSKKVMRPRDSSTSAAPPVALASKAVHLSAQLGLRAPETESHGPYPDGSSRCEIEQRSFPGSAARTFLQSE